MKNKYVVRVTVSHHQRNDASLLLLEQFRYAGLISMKSDQSEFDMIPPRGVDNKVWALQTANRMISYGFTATIAESR